MTAQLALRGLQKEEELKIDVFVLFLRIYKPYTRITSVILLVQKKQKYPKNSM